MAVWRHMISLGLALILSLSTVWRFAVWLAEEALPSLGGAAA